MPHYFYVIQATLFEDEIRPALATAWRQRSFEPCATLCRNLLSAAEGFALRYHLGPKTLFIPRVAQGLAFSKDAWRSLVGDLLLVSASVIPEVQTAAETLSCLLSSRAGPDGNPRAEFTPIEQAHFGTRDLVFGGGFYRPEHAGWNDAPDVARLAEYLESVDAGRWTAEQLAPMTELAADDREEELEFARQCLGNLAELYCSARGGGHIIVCELV